MLSPINTDTRRYLTVHIIKLMITRTLDKAYIFNMNYNLLSSILYAPKLTFITCSSNAPTPR